MLLISHNTIFQWNCGRSPFQFIQNACFVAHLHQGFMQDKIIASHTCFGGHVDVNC